MTSFLGPLGSLIPVKCASRLSVSGGRGVSFSRTLGKQKAFLGQVRSRQWDVSINLATPGELSGLAWLAEYSAGPLVWYSPDAVVGNVLPPNQVALVPGTHDGLGGPLVEVAPGVHVKSVFADGHDYVNIQRTGGVNDPAPVPADSSVTCSVWMRGNTLGGRQLLRVRWYDLAGQEVETVDTDFPVSAEWARRSVTVTSPSNAATVRIMPYAAQVAGPCVTLTNRLAPYAPGLGAKQVVVHGLSSDLVLASVQRQYRSLSFAVSEVG